VHSWIGGDAETGHPNARSASEDVWGGEAAGPPDKRNSPESVVGSPERGKKDKAVFRRAKDVRSPATGEFARTRDERKRDTSFLVHSP